MNAYEVSNPLSYGDEFRFSFGVNDAKVAAALRKLADGIESTKETVLIGDENRMPRITVERFSVENTAHWDDFTLTKITIVIAEKVRPQNEVRE